MKLSIIIPVYNAKNTLKRCLDSVFAQKVSDFEINKNSKLLKFKN